MHYSPSYTAKRIISRPDSPIILHLIYFITTTLKALLLRWSKTSSNNKTQTLPPLVYRHNHQASTTTHTRTHNHTRHRGNKHSNVPTSQHLTTTRNTATITSIRHSNQPNSLPSPPGQASASSQDQDQGHCISLASNLVHRL